MSAITKQDIANESKFMTEFWKFIKEYYTPEENDEYWEGVLKTARQIDKDCNSRLGQHLMNAYIDYLEEKRNGGYNPQRKMQAGGGANANQGRG